MNSIFSNPEFFTALLYWLRHWSESESASLWVMSDCSPPGSSIHGILQARILEYIAIPCSRGSSQTRYLTRVSCLTSRHFTIWATREIILRYLLLFSRLVVSYSLQPHGLQDARLPCPSPSPRACSNSCPLSLWYHSTISSSVIPSSSCLQSFPASGSFLMCQLFTSGGQSTGIWASASVLPINIQAWFPLGLTGLISLQSKGLSRVFSNTTVQKHQLFGVQPSLWSSYQIHAWLLEKTIALTRQTFVSKVMSLLLNILSRLVRAFLSRSKHLLISWLQSQSAMTLQPKKRKSLTVSIISPSVCHEVMGPDATIFFIFLNVEF